MSNTPKTQNYKTLQKVAVRLKDDLNSSNFILLYAYNGTGKTRLSMEFKDWEKKKNKGATTLYYNAFTEDLFHWDNDLDSDINRYLKINERSEFFNGFKELAIEDKIYEYLNRYTDIQFKIDYDEWLITFSKEKQENIKISRGEENMFIWCVFLAICQLVIEEDESYNWVKYIYIDDPVSSLDDNNVISIACDLAQLIKKGVKNKTEEEGKKFVISTHHNLFFNIMYNELKKDGCKSYLLYKNNQKEYSLKSTDDTPFLHHISLLGELRQIVQSNDIKTHHFNTLRSILEKTATFFGYDDFSKCIIGIRDENLYARALNLLSHGRYNIYAPVEMTDDNKNLFKNILEEFLKKYEFYIPEIFSK